MWQLSFSPQKPTMGISLSGWHSAPPGAQSRASRIPVTEIARSRCENSHCKRKVIAPPLEKPMAKRRERSRHRCSGIHSKMARAKATSSVAGSVWHVDMPAFQPRRSPPSAAVP